MKAVSAYHMVLRVTGVMLALLLVFDSGVLLPVTKELSIGAQQYVANTVGATARVEQTELNTLTAELTRQKKELDEREVALNERELSVGLGGGTQQSVQSDSISTYILSVLLFIILVLIVLNYALDFARSRRLTYMERHP